MVRCLLPREDTPGVAYFLLVVSSFDCDRFCGEKIPRKTYAYTRSNLAMFDLEPTQMRQAVLCKYFRMTETQGVVALSCDARAAGRSIQYNPIPI